MGWFGWGSDGSGESVNVKVSRDTLTTKTEVIRSTDGDRANHSHSGIVRNDFTGKESRFKVGSKKSR